MSTKPLRLTECIRFLFIDVLKHHAKTDGQQYVL